MTSISSPSTPHKRHLGGHSRLRRRQGDHERRPGSGKEYELDCLIYSTGYEWYTEWEQRTQSQIYGRDGLTRPSRRKWSDGVSTFHGWGSARFPELHGARSAQVNNVPNYTHMVGHISRHLAYIAPSRTARTVASVSRSLLRPPRHTGYNRCSTKVPLDETR